VRNAGIVRSASGREWEVGNDERYGPKRNNVARGVDDDTCKADEKLGGGREGA
jgi:hypothetical protein